MPFVRPDPLKSLRPKTASLSDLYRHTTGVDSMSRSVKAAAKKALGEAGYGQRQVDKIVERDREMKLAELKATADKLNDGRVFGFKKPGRFLVDDYTRGEAVKKRSLKRLMEERRIEALDENLTQAEKDRNDLIINRLRRRI